MAEIPRAAPGRPFLSDDSENMLAFSTEVGRGLHPASSAWDQLFCFTGRDRVHLFQYFIRRFECVEASWDAAVNRGVDENFLDLIDGNAVVERTANMKFHFRRAVQRREHGEIDQTPRLPVESGA